ncbi:MAG: hypothetical protein HW416_72 [Chloroflexi bacterium]|nr:hypothetical protein [Chloroflexota bacterium]
MRAPFRRSVAAWIRNGWPSPPPLPLRRRGADGLIPIDGALSPSSTSGWADRPVTLDLLRVGNQLERMGEHLRDSRDGRRARLDLARAWFQASASSWQKLADMARASGRTCAAPTEPLDTVHAAPPALPSYEVLASDGSSIEPDRHGLTICALINVGLVRLRYGDSPFAALSNEPRLYFRPEELYVEQAGGRVLLQERLLDARRSVAEMRALGQLADEPSTIDAPRVALADGLLTIWRQDWAGAGADEVSDQLGQALDAIRGRGLPLAAYVSNPHGHLLIDTLRMAARCQYGQSGCEVECSEVGCAFDGLIDLSLYDQLKPGDRSGLLQAAGRDADRHGEHNRSHFFYVHVGREVARVEVPRWVAEDNELIERVHSVVVDQATRGQGYPVALARAHEQAVISGGDRRAFQQLVAEALQRAGMSAGLSEKQASKNLRAV